MYGKESHVFLFSTEEYRVLKSSLTTEEAIARLSELNKIVGFIHVAVILSQS